MLELIAVVFVAIFLVGGDAATLWKGRIRASNTSVVEGLPARVVGLLLLAALPSSFVALFFHGPVLKAIGEEPGPLSPLPMLVFRAPLLACPLLAVIVGFASAKRVSVASGRKCPKCGSRGPRKAEYCGCGYRFDRK
jgi:hypothetical protein